MRTKTFIGCLSLAAILPLQAQASEEVVNESRFHLLTFKCEASEGAGAETAPQSPPLRVDDPGTPGCNRWELNVIADGDLTSSQNSWETPLLDINYGIGDNLQLKYEVPYLSTNGSSTDRAVGESKAGIKAMFFEDETSKLELAIYPQVSFMGSNSDAVQKGLATPGSVVTLPLLMEKVIGRTRLGDVSLTANLGYNLSFKADTADFVSGAVALGTAVTSRMSVMGEVVTDQAVAIKGSEEVRNSLVAANLGLMGRLSRNFMLFGSVGHSLYTSDAESHKYALAGARIMVGGM